jgi:hypothetical protein
MISATTTTSTSPFGGQILILEWPFQTCEDGTRLEGSWNVLRAAGLPEGAVRALPKGPMDAASAVEALRSLVVADGELDTIEQECLAAWPAAFRHHWSDRFTDLLGPVGEDACHRSVVTVSDRNRCLKLRRVAIENLSRLL